MSDAITRVEASWEHLLSAIEGIGQERMSEPGVAGDWSVKDVLGHVAFWEDRVIGAIERAMNDAPDPPSSGLDVDQINENVTAERAGWSVTQSLNEFQGTHERLLATLRKYPDVDPALIEGDTFEHYDEHATDIRAWRERAGI